MKLYSSNENYKLYQGNMLDMLEIIESNTIDSIITDPPYELNFMSKGWDNAGVSFQKETWQKCYEVLKPGGYLLAFGGSRTFHRIACAIEDAGFEIRDTIMYLYGSGFPKSQNIGKQLEKRYEDEKTKQKTEHDLLRMWERDIQKTKRDEKKQENILLDKLQEQSMEKSSNTTSTLWGKEPSVERWNNIQKTERELQRCKICEMSKRVHINGEERWICNGTQACDGYALREMFETRGSCPSFRPQSSEQQDKELDAIQKQWGTQACREVIENWKKIGTALKPSFEPIIVARKPFKGTLVDNIIENGVGGINIDECRVGNEERQNPQAGFIRRGRTDEEVFLGTDKNRPKGNLTVNGRFPANTILTYDETDFDEVCGGFPNTKSQYRNVKSTEKLNKKDTVFETSGYKNRFEGGFNDSGSASRYFYCAKASKKDRDEGCQELEDTVNACSNQAIAELKRGNDTFSDETNSTFNKVYKGKNTHPTVKPTELMQYLARLVTPNNGTILDPFNGSGSTGKAVMYENKERNKNYKYIGIELTEEYLPISKARIEYVCNLIEEDKLQDKQMTIFDVGGINE